jgi:DNA (cytosine-5)-methyltransferase 1
MGGEPSDVVHTLSALAGEGDSSPHVAFCATGEVFHTLRADGFDASEDGTGRDSGAVAICFTAQDHGAGATNDLSPTLRAGGHSKSHANAGVMPAVAFAPISFGAQMSEPQTDVDLVQTLQAKNPAAVAFAPMAFDLKRGLAPHGGASESDHAFPLAASNHKDPPIIRSALHVRRLTPTECERLQGFPDGWTAIPYRGKPASDGPRYKALGNSMAVPVMAWIGRRIDQVDKIVRGQ